MPALLRLLFGAALVGLAALSPAPAAANGKFPSAGQIVVDPGDPGHILVRTTFGILVTRDAGGRFDWICEAGAGYGGGDDPGIAVTGDGSILAGVFQGLDVAHGDACTWQLAGGAVAGLVVSDVSVQRTHPSTAVALASGPLGSAVFRSDDNAVTWTQAGTYVPGALVGLTLDLAPSDASRIYVSGIRLVDGGFRAALARSPDGGGTWEILDIGPAGSSAPYLAGIDPSDPQVVYVRLDATPGQLLVTKDGGSTWTSVLTLPGYVAAFALSPDGATVLAGGPTDGVWRASTADHTFTRVSSMAATCLAWSGPDVYACGSSVAVSHSIDQGQTFAPLLTLACVHGPLACDPATPVGSQCPAAWPQLAQQLGAAYCHGDAGPPGAEAAASSASSGGAAGSGTGGGPAHGESCACRAGHDGAGPGAFSALALAAAAALRRRGARPARRL
jgi:MYXO-CTERM domain-containing protein